MDPIKTNPTSMSLNDLLASASQAIAAQKLAVAEQALKQAVAIAPDSADAQRLAGVVQLMRGNPGNAVGHLHRAVELRPGDFYAHMDLGNALFACRDTQAALASLRHACELAPDAAGTWYNLGRTLHIAQRIEEARPALLRAHALDPSHAMTSMILASVQNSLGEIAEAAGLYRGVLKNQPDHARAWFELCNLKTVKLDDAEFLQLRQLLERADLSVEARIRLGFALAKSLEDRGDLEASFKALQLANAIKHRHAPWNIEAERRRVDGIMRAFSQPLLPPLDPTLGNEIIFIACLPRSGSTLVEHILASHSMVEGANEISDLQIILQGESTRRRQVLTEWAPRATAADWHRLGREYLERTAHWRSNKPRSTDKNLGNWSVIGLALAMLPGARVVNIRRDPLETCFACYRQLFPDGVSYTNDFESMAHYYAGYERISRFWKERFPENYRDHVYEDMLADPEGSIRELLEFCRLPFEPDCLEFHKTSRVVRSTASAAQVRQPLQSDTARAPRYGALLDPLREQLRRLGVPSQD